MELSVGALHKIVNEGEHPTDPSLQILALKKFEKEDKGKERYRVLLSDARNSVGFAMLVIKPNTTLTPRSVIRLTRYHLSDLPNKKKDSRILVILDYDVLAAGEDVEQIGSPTTLVVGAQGAEGAPTGSGGSSFASTAAPTPQSNGAGAGLNSSTSGGKMVYPIVSLSPYRNNWVIKVRVSNKSNIRSWSNARGEGKLFNVDLLDESGEIRLTAFRDMVDKYYDFIEVDKVYYISKCQVKPANSQFNALKNDYEMTMTSETVVEPCEEDDGGIPKVQYNFVSLKEVATKEAGSILDVIGVCKEVTDLDIFTSKSSNRELKKRSVTLVDQSNTSMELTLWDTQAETFDGANNPVIAIKGAKVGTFGGGVSISTLMSSQMKLNPDIVECHRLKAWFDGEGKLASMTNVSGRTGGGVQAEFSTFREVLQRGMGKSGRGEYYKNYATILLARSENSVYKSCPTTDCNKKVSDLGNGMYRCEKCAKEFPNHDYRLLLSMNLGDYSGNQWVTLFATEAEKILGKTSAEIGAELENDSNFTSQFYNTVAFQEHLFTYRVKSEVYNDDARLKTIVVRVDPVNYFEQNKHLLAEIEKYKNV